MSTMAGLSEENTLFEWFGMPFAVTRKQWPLTPVGILLVVVLFTLLPRTCAALEGRVDLSSGYDDNVAANADKQGSSFMRYQLELYQTLVDQPSLYAEAYGWASAHEFSRVDDRQEFLIGASCLKRWRDGAWHSLFYAEGRSYRDDLVDEDEYDGFEVGCQVQHFVDEHLTVGVSGSYRYADYRRGFSWLTTVTEESEPESGPGSGNGNGSGSGNTTSVVTEEFVAVDEERQDDQFAVIGRLEYRFSADVFSDLKLFYQDNDSTLSWESYQAYGIEHGWQVQLNPRLSSELWGSWLQRDYPDYEEKQWTVTARLDWQWQQHLGVYMQVQQMWQRSDFSGDDYTQKVATCGLSWFF